MKKIVIYVWLFCRSCILKIANRLGWHPNTMNIEQSIDCLIYEAISVSRFGDGEIMLMEGYDIAFQQCVPGLRRRLIDIAGTEINLHKVAVPNVFQILSSFNKDARDFWSRFLFWGNGIVLINKYFKKHRLYLDTNMTRFYEHLKDKSACHIYVNKWKQVWRNKDLLIIEGRGSRLGTFNDLFEGAISISRIICPAENAYTYYEQIFVAAKRHAEGRLVMIALGPTATVLAFDLAKIGIQAIDVGHIDIEYEWFRMKATHKMPVKGRYVNEANQREVYECNNKVYLSQIVEIIE